MLDVKYYKDYRHNYLIIKCEALYGENTYQRKMITTNVIRGLLGCQERHVNGETLLYYEITSRQSLASSYAVRHMDWELLQKFFRELKLVNDMLQKYLLDAGGLVLNPEFIFLNMDTEEFAFLYDPEERQEGFTELMDFLIEKVNSEDSKATEMVYRIADLVHREQFVLDEVLEWFQEREESQKTDWQEERAVEWDLQRAACQGGVEDEEQETGSENKNQLMEKDRQAAVLLAVGLLLSAVLFYMTYCYRISGMRRILMAAGWILALLCMVGAAVCYVGRKYLGKKDFRNIWKCREKGEQRPEENNAKTPGYRAPFEYELPKKEGEECGNTVFIPWLESCENRLYGMDKGNKYHIDLNHLPLTVGKMAGAVDMMIGEQSISRMHARFSRMGDKICITDLNSTNGTFKNGLRLTPNASEIIEPGDEIRLGKLKFIYR